MRQRLETLVDEKVHDRQSRLSWLREPQPRVASASLAEILEKVALIRRTGISCVPVDPLHEPRMTQFAREGVRYTAQAFQQMRASRRRVILLAPLREMEATLTDAAIAMRSEEHPSELQSLMRSPYAVFCLKKKKNTQTTTQH